MRLIYVLLIAISVLTIVSALVLVFGSLKAEKMRGLWFLMAAIGEVLWGVSIAGFLSLGVGECDYKIAPLLIKGIYVGAILMDSMILGYVSWKYKYGKIATSILIVAGAILSIVFLCNPQVLYHDFVLSHSGNYVNIRVDGWFYISYIVYFCTIVPCFCLGLVYNIRHAADKETKKGSVVFLIGLALAGGLSLIFDLLLAPQRYDLIWVGPLVIGLTMVAFYYSVLRFRMISLTAGWLKILSFIVVIGAAIILYLLVFHLVFSVLFKVANPSFQVILLNFIMIAIALLLAPGISEILSFAKSLIMMKQIDVAYIIKKLVTMNGKKIDLEDLSGFLSEHMHFLYIGFLVNEKYFVADDRYAIPVKQLTKISEMPVPEKGIWQEIDDLDESVRKEYGIVRIATLTNTNGEMVGHVVFGKPISKGSLDKRDLVEIEMIMMMVGMLIR